MDFVGTILSSLIEPVINYVKRHGAYVIRYKSKVQLLEQENKRLGEKKETIQVMVDTATNSGKVIKTKVSSWLKDAEDMEGDIANILHPQDNRESFKCFKCCMCPNLMWRYKRGKDADDRKSNVTKLISRGEPLQTSPVARDAPFQWEPHFDSSQYYTTFDSRASVFNKIMDALKYSGVDMIGVHGPGGAGKTTMVKEVAKEAKKLGIFNTIVIAVVSKDPNPSKLQEDIAPQLELKYEQTSQCGRADELRKALLKGGRKILVILDDLWLELDLNAIGIPISGLGDRGCKILLTSRNEEVFNMMEVHSCFPIGYLDEQETWKLFTKVTGDFGVDESIARKVCERCGGLPIAIVAVGAALRGEEELEWENALHQLENCPLKHIEGIRPKDYTPLKWSYDFLEEKDAKSCFLLCCLFPEDAEIFIEDLVRYSFALGFLEKVDTLKAARYRVQAMVNMLRRSCLLLNGEEENFVKMHDLIRDLAISITKDKQTKHGSGHDWPGQQQFMVDHNIRRLPRNDAWKSHTAISLRNNDHNFTFPCSVLDCPLVHTLVLKHGKSDLKIPNDFFQGMKEARVLDVEGTSLELPSSIWALDNLRMLSINNCHLLGDLSRIQNLKNHLEILRIVNSVGIRRLPRDIEELTLLRSLDLRNCGYLRVIPKGVISKLIHLEELYVTEKFNWWDTTVGGGMSNASINELSSLTQLTVLHVAMLTESFKILVLECHDLFEKLTNFAININSQYQGMNGSLNVLGISDIHRIDYDKFHLLMDKVDDLKLEYIQDLRYLGDKPGSFCKLTYLDIAECDTMKYLFSPSCAKAFQQLKVLLVRDCGRMEQIIGVGDHYNEEEVGINEVIIFSRLTVMTLRSLPQFRCFYPKMKKATIGINSLYSAESIIDEKVCFPMLEELTIDQLPVKYLFSPSCAKVFQQLKLLHVENCGRMEQIIGVGDYYNEEEVGIDEVIIFSQLTDLTLRSLPQFRCFCSNMKKATIEDSFPVLEILKIYQLPGKYLFSPSCAKTFQQLKLLHVENCGRMEQIIGVGDHHNEEEVGIDEVIIFSRLTEMTLRSLPQFRCFCPKMKKATIEGNWLNSAESIFNEKVSFPMLEELTIDQLPVKYLFSPSCAKASQQLKLLHVENCGRMEQIIGVGDHYNEEEVGIDEVIIFSRLMEMTLRSLPQFRCFCPKMKKVTIEVFFPMLEELKIDQLPVKYLFCPFCAKAFQQLNLLHVENCDRMEQIIGVDNHYNEEKVGIDEVIIFSQLTEMTLRSLPQFRCFCLKMKKATSGVNLLNSQESIIDEKDFFPALEILKIVQLPGKYLFSPSCAKAFQQLKLLHVENCGRMEQIIGVGDHYNEEEVGIDEVIIFSRLTEMTLGSLPQFRCFCPKMKKATIEGNLLNLAEFIIDEKVSFPVLELLVIYELPMKYLFSPSCAKAFQQLKELYVGHCGRMEQIIGVDDHYNEEEVGIDEVIIFSRLTRMTLRFLPQFRCFCSKMRKVTIEGNWLNSAESIFNEKVFFPVLEMLIIYQLPVEYLFSSSCAKGFHQLKKLSIFDCGRMEQIIGVGDHYNEEEVRVDEVIIFSRLREMTLQSLPQFRCFCPKMKKATIEGNLLNSSESIFNEKDSFPVLEILKIYQLPGKYLFSPSCAKTFQQLKLLHVENCGRMEQIIGVGDHYNEEEVGIDEVIIFSRLMVMTLRSLPQFRCFCPKMKKATIEVNWLNSAESIFNEKVSFPVLERLNISQLPVKNIWNKETIQSSNSSE